MAFIDYYKILGVSKDIPQSDVKKAYLKRAKQFHPDLHPDDPKAKAKFQALNEAYDVIGDPEKRRKYDQYGERWKDVGNFGTDNGTYSWDAKGGASPFDDIDFNSFSGGFSSFFKDLFGNAGKRGARGFDGFGANRRNTGEMNASVNIDLYTALLGGEVVILLNNGTKVKLRVKPETQNGTKVRLRGKGYDRGDGSFGDLIITFNVLLPKNLSERQKELLEQMRRG